MGSDGRLLLFAAVAMLGWHAPAEAASGLATRVVQATGVALAVPLDGTVEAVRQATVAAQVAGRVIEVRADAGQAVRQGALLMRLDGRESAEAVAAAQASAANAKLNYERTRNLHLQKFVSAAAVDKAKADYDSALAGLQASRATQSHAAVVAPLSGLIAQRHTELGEMAAPGKPLFTVYDPGGLRLVVHVPQSRLAEVRAARKAVVEFPESGQRVESVSLQILPMIDAQTHVAEVRIGLPASAAFASPGMVGRVLFASSEARKLTLPRDALVRRGEVTGAYVRAGNGTYRLRQLRLGESTVDGEIEVLAGLVAGEEVALDAVKAGLALKQALADARGAGGAAK